MILFDRFLDDVALHHLIDALCKLSAEAMDVAYANKVYFVLCHIVSGVFFLWSYLTIVGGLVACRVCLILSILPW